MSSRRNSKRNYSSATDAEPASKRRKQDDSSTIESSNDDRNDEQEQPRVPDLGEAAIATLPPKERSCLVDLPYPDQVQKYVDWCDSGRPHDERCFICDQGDELIYCYTCKRSYHSDCMTSPHDLPGEDWWCPLCVLRGWDKWAPEATLDTPLLVDSIQSIPEAGESHRTQLKTGPAPSTTDVPQKEPVTQSAEKQPQYYAPHPNHRPPPVQPITPAMRPVQPSAPRQTPPIDNRDQSLKQRAQPRARKSRYSNFLPEVDSAISIIYRELESTADLRSQLVDTQTEVRTLSQELRIRDNQLLLANKISASKQALEAEVSKLRAELASKSSSSGEVEYLKEGYAKLEVEIRELRAELQQKIKEKDEWRDKLRRLIEPGAP